MVFNLRVIKLQTYINEAGLTAMAQRLGVSAQRLSNWMQRGVPIEQCAAIEAATGGAVRRWDMRPSDWHRIWPELIRADGAPMVDEPHREAA